MASMLLLSAAAGIALPRLWNPAPARSVLNASRSAAMVAAVTGGGFSFDDYEYLALKRRRIDEALDKIALDLGRQSAASSSSKKIRDAMSYSLLANCKRIRPILTIAACEAVGGDEAVAMPSAIAVEMIHTMSLIHDDLPCVDDGDLRRGRPSCHVAFGEAAAVLTGDALLSLAFRHVAAAGSPPDRAIRILADLGFVASSMIGGEIVDVCSEGKEEIDLALLEYIADHKSGILLGSAAAVGAIAGGAGEEDVERARRYGRCMGTLFQIVDDVIDATRSPGEMGKTAGQDVAAGKATFLKLLGLPRAKEMAGELMGRAEAELAGFEPTDRAEPILRFNSELKKWVFEYLFLVE